MSSLSVLVIQNFSEASDDIVTNCDVGPACGMFQLVEVFVIVLAAALVVGAVKRWRNR